MNLGEFEHVVLLAILRLGDEAYAIPIRQEIEERTGRAVARGALYTALERLESKRCLRSRMSQPLAERGGRYYLLATPITAKDNRYDGCSVFRFEDLKYGKLERRRGKLVVAQTVRGIPDTHHGACAAHARLKGGILVSQIFSVAAPRVMQIRRSGVELPRD